MVTDYKNITLETQNLFIRNFADKDVEEFQKQKELVWQELQRWMSWSSDDQADLEATLKFLDFSKNRKDGACLLAFEKASGNMAVVTGFDFKGNNIFATGYWAPLRMRGHGYAEEATREIIHFLFERCYAKAVEIEHYEGNEASRHIIEKLGFKKTNIKQEGHKQHLNGQLINVHQYILNKG